MGANRKLWSWFWCNRADERIRAVLLVGSRANPAVAKDIWQDYDITCFVEDITPFYNNPVGRRTLRQTADNADA